MPETIASSPVQCEVRLVSGRVVASFGIDYQTHVGQIRKHTQDYTQVLSAQILLMHGDNILIDDMANTADFCASTDTKLRLTMVKESPEQASNRHIERLSDSLASVRQSACESLAVLPSSTELKNGVCSCLNDTDLDVRIAAIHSIHQLGCNQPDLVHVKVSPLHRSVDSYIRAQSRSGDRNRMEAWLASLALYDFRSYVFESGHQHLMNDFHACTSFGPHHLSHLPSLSRLAALAALRMAGLLSNSCYQKRGMACFMISLMGCDIAVRYANVIAACMHAFVRYNACKALRTLGAQVIGQYRWELAGCLADHAVHVREQAWLCLRVLTLLATDFPFAKCSVQSHTLPARFIFRHWATHCKSHHVECQFGQCQVAKPTNQAPLSVVLGSCRQYLIRSFVACMSYLRKAREESRKEGQLKQRQIANKLAREILRKKSTSRVPLSTFFPQLFLESRRDSCQLDLVFLEGASHEDDGPYECDYYHYIFTKPQKCERCKMRPQKRQRCATQRATRGGHLTAHGGTQCKFRERDRQKSKALKRSRLHKVSQRSEGVGGEVSAMEFCGNFNNCNEYLSVAPCDIKCSQSSEGVVGEISAMEFCANSDICSGHCLEYDLGTDWALECLYPEDDYCEDVTDFLDLLETRQAPFTLVEYYEFKWEGFISDCKESRERARSNQTCCSPIRHHISRRKTSRRTNRFVD